MHLSKHSPKIQLITSNPNPLLLINIILQLIRLIIPQTPQIKVQVEVPLIIMFVKHQVNIHNILPLLILFRHDNKRFPIILKLNSGTFRSYIFQKRVRCADRIYPSEMDDTVGGFSEFNVSFQGELLDWNLEFFHNFFHHVVAHGVYSEGGDFV